MLRTHPITLRVQAGSAPADFDVDGEHTVFSDELVQLIASGLKDTVVSSSAGGFTDGDIAQSHSGLVNRELERADWLTPTGGDVGDLEDTSGSGGKWDQFAENERRFGVKSTYKGELHASPNLPARQASPRRRPACALPPWRPAPLY